MQKRPLGQSGMEASVIGFGAWGIGGWMWGGSDRKQSIEAIHAGLDAGVNLIDTAPVYGFGLSEEVVGEAIADRRDEVILATKCGLVCGTSKGSTKMRSTASGISPNGHIPVHQYLGGESIREEVEASLRRLQTDRIDLYQTHWQDETTPIADTMETLMELKAEGKIRAIGVSNASSAQMEQYRQVGPVDSDQERFSMIDRRIESDQLPYCQRAGIAMLAFSPLAQGLLTGKITPDQGFSEGDMRRRDPRFSEENRRRILEMLEHIEPLAKQRDLSIAQLVTAWTFHVPGVTHVLCGMRSVEHARENAAAGEVQLSDEEFQTISERVAPQVAEMT